jgi:WD40 repeat protein
VLDWGIAKLRDGKDEDERETLANFRAKLITEHGAQAATEMGQAVGTPGYMAPEQAMGNTKLVDERSDVFSLGIMLYEILCGERAFDGKNMSTLLDQTVRLNPKPLATRDSKIPPELISICERAINKDPRHRYQSVKTMIRDLESFQTGALVASHEYSWTTLLARTYKKHRTLVLAGAASTAIIAAVAAYSYLSIWQARDNERAQRVRAEGAEGEAKANLVAAEEQRDLAETERARAEEESWLASTRLLHRALQDGEFGTVRAMLDKVPEERRGWEWRYAKHASSRETIILSQPGERPHNLEFNDARTRALVLYDNWRARVWDILGRKPLFESQKLPDRLNVGVLLDDGATVALGYAHGVVIVHEVGSGAELGRANLGGHPCSALAAMSDDELIIGAEDGRVLRWAWRSGAGPELITQVAGRINGLHLSPLRQLVCAWHGEETLTLFPSAGGSTIAEFPGRMAGFNPDGALYASDHAGRCEVRNTSDGTIAWATDPAGDQFHSGRTDARGNLVARGANGRAVAFDVTTGRQIYSLSGEVTVDAAISTDGRYFLALDDKGFVSWTDLETGALIDRAGGHEGRPGALLALEEGNAATLDVTGNVRFWSQERAVQTSAQWIADVERFYIQGLAGAKNGILAVTQQDDDVSLLNSVSGRPIGKLASQSLGNPRPTELSEDGAVLVSSPDAFSLASVPTDFSAPPTLYLGSTGLIASIAISADATLIANADNHGRVNFYKVGDPKPIGQVQCGEDYLPGADFLPDGSLLVGSATGVLYHLGTNPPTLLKTVEASKSPVRQMTCSSVSNLVAIGYASGEIELRDAKTLDSLSTTKASAGEITKLIFSASGDRIFSSSDENISIWLLTSNRSLEESGLYWNQGQADIALSGPNEDLWCCTLGRPLSVYRTSAPEAQAQADQGSFTIATLVTPERLAEIAARLNELVPDWRAQLSSGNPIPEGPLSEALSGLGLSAGTKLNATSPAGSLEAFLDLLGPNARCGNAIPWSGGNRSGHTFKGLVSVVCAEQLEITIDLTDEECKQLQTEFLGALQFYGTGLTTQLQMRTEDWLGWPPAEDTVQLWLPDMSVSPLKPWLTKLRLSVFDRIVAIDDRRFDNPSQLIEYLRQTPGEGEAPGSTVRLQMKRGAFSEPVVLMQ